jgi:hypothetical protein
LKSQRKCKRLKPRKLLTKVSKKQRLNFKREKLRMRHWLRRNVEIFTTYRLNAKVLELLVKLRPRLKLWLYN